MNLLIVLNLPEPVRETYRTRLAEVFPQMHIDMVTHNSEAGPFLEKADAMLAFGVMLSDDIFARGRAIKWVQALGSGVDGIVDQPSFCQDILVTNMQGIHGPPCAEAAICAMFDLARSVPRVLDNQRNRRWQRFPVRLLDGKKIAVIGLGVIAEALGPRCQALGMHVTGVTGSPRALPGFDAVVARDAMMDVVRESDFVVLLTPHTKQNHHLANAQFIAAMKPEAFLVNIARGGVVDEAALIEALRARRIAGAALDVFETEPLAEDHPFWSMDNVIVTPHLGGFHDEYPKRALPILEHNVSQFLAGDIDGMINIVNRGSL